MARKGNAGLKSLLAGAAVVSGLAMIGGSPALAQDKAAIARVEAGQSCANCDLFQADLSYRELVGKTYSGARLRQSDFTVAIVDGSRFDGANLSLANLYGVRGTGTRFVGADLSGATLVGTIFDGANFTKARMLGTNLSGADLGRAKGLTQGQLREACGDSATRLPQGLTVPAC